MSQQLQAKAAMATALSIRFTCHWWRPCSNLRCSRPTRDANVIAVDRFSSDPSMSPLRKRIRRSIQILASNPKRQVDSSDDATSFKEHIQDSSQTRKKMVQSPAFCQLENQFITLLEICKTTYQLKQIHSQVIKFGLSSSAIRNKLIALYNCTRRGDIIQARQLFDEMSECSILLWNTMIKGYSGMETPEYGLHMYMDMLKKGVKPDKYTYPFLLKGFRSSGDVAYTCGMQLLGHIIMLGFDSNEHVRSAFVHMFSSSGQIQMARKFFNLSCKWNVVTWNELISGYNKVKQFDESKRLYIKMEQNVVSPTSITFLLALTASSKSKDLRFGEVVHRSIRESKIQPSLTLENALINMYTACGEMKVALQIFEGMNRRDAITWTTIVTGFVNEGRIDLARKYFDEMPQRDQVSWTAMINGYLKANEFREALKLFGEMQTSKVKADEFTVVSILIACANLGALELGEWAKTFIDQNSIKDDIFVRNALIDMYFKCGCVEQATSEFNRMPQRDKFTWTTMIAGLAYNGHGEKALQIFSEMLRASIKPDGITYIGVLMACAHTGMVQVGRELFSRMTAQHGIMPELAHFGCLIDLLGRSGLLEEAKEVINSMPMRPNAVIWGALLGACKLHKDQEMAEMAAKEILELEPNNDAVYVLLCNVFAACRMWEKLSEVRRIMTEKGIQKDPGCSTIEIKGSIHKFVAGDESHPQSDEIYAKLEEVMTELRHAGYRLDTS